MKRKLSFLLALILLLSVLPLGASAVVMKDYKDAHHYQQVGGGFASTYTFENGKVYADLNGNIIKSNVPGYKVGDVITQVTGVPGTYYAAHLHEYEWTVNRDGHFFRCTCGAKQQFQEHVMQEDGTCVCGYEFMDNADLTVLWMRGIQLKPGFKKGTTEYEGKLIYKDLKETAISAFPFDAKATVEIPEDLTLKKGTNTFEVKVTAENGKDTKTYTVKVEVE